MIFDTDVIVWAARGNAAAARAINNAADRALSIITLMELLQGARSKVEAKQMQQSLRQSKFRVLPLSESIGAIAISIIEEHALSHGIRLADAMIAATALESDDSLCTGNGKHFRPIRSLSVSLFHVPNAR